MPVSETRDYTVLANVARELSDEFRQFRYTPTPEPNNWSVAMKQQLAIDLQILDDNLRDIIIEVIITGINKCRLSIETWNLEHFASIGAISNINTLRTEMNYRFVELNERFDELRNLIINNQGGGARGRGRGRGG